MLDTIVLASPLTFTTARSSSPTMRIFTQQSAPSLTGWVLWLQITTCGSTRSISESRSLGSETLTAARGRLYCKARDRLSISAQLQGHQYAYHHDDHYLSIWKRTAWMSTHAAIAHIWLCYFYYILPWPMRLAGGLVGAAPSGGLVALCR